MILRRIYNDQFAQAAYLVGCESTREALILDPNRDMEQYIRAAEQEGLRITAVTETHIHADFVSGAWELAQRTGARLLLSDAGPAEWKYRYAREAGAVPICDGDVFQVGEVRLQAVHTPGHTPEHLSFLLTDAAVANESMGVFTGDFLFVGDVGRPDLLETAVGVVGAKEDGARSLFASLARFRELPDYLQVWPGHGAGSPCGRALGSIPQSTLGYEKRFNWAFGVREEAEFVRAVLSDQPDTPAYFARMKQLNQEGPPPLLDSSAPEELPPTMLRSDLERGTVVLDLRSPERFASGHAPGSVNIPLGSGFLAWVGSLIGYDRPLALLGEPHSATEAARQLRFIGHDTLAGYWTPQALRYWEASVGPLATIHRVTPAQVREQLAREEVQVLDVRRASEHAAGHIEGSRNIPLAQLRRGLAALPADRPVLVHCQGGLRSAIAASILTAHGRSDVLDLEGGYGAWQDATTRG